MDPSLLKIADLADTRICPLARVMRKELKKRGIEHVRVIHSEEAPYREDRSSTKDMPCHKDHASTDSAPTPEKRVKDTPASAIFVPAAAGLMMANEVVRNLL